MARGKWKAGAAGTIVTQMEFAPIWLKKLVIECDITQGELAEAAGVSRPAINSCLNKGYIPSSIPDFRERVTRLVEANTKSAEWLIRNGLKLADIWLPLYPAGHKGEALLGKHPAGHIRRSMEGQKRGYAAGPAMIPGNPETIDIKEVEMISQEARRHFKLFRDPFQNDVQTADDIYMSDEHRYLEAAMLDAAKFNGFLAIVGQVGSGKSTIRKRVVEQLRKEGDVHVVFPQILDKEKISSATLCDAIIMDISDQRPKVKHEHKARQVKQLLLARSQNEGKCCLIIEEAHNLTVAAFKTLKQLHELEDGYKKLIGIILIGQTELGDKLNEQYHPEMREVIRRAQVARINGLNGNLADYLEKKFKRVNTKLETIMDPEAVTALSKRLASPDERGKKVSHAYPLTVNLYAVRAINLAYEMGESKVTAEVIEAI